MSKPVQRLQSQQEAYAFGPFYLAPAQRRLLRDGKAVSLTPKTFDLLLVLVRNSGQLVEKDELIKAVWPNSVVEESNLPYTISMLRKALGESKAAAHYVETVARSGYRFTAAVSYVVEEDSSVATGQRIGAQSNKEALAQGSEHQAIEEAANDVLTATSISVAPVELASAVEEPRLAQPLDRVGRFSGALNSYQKVGTVLVVAFVTILISITYGVTKWVDENDPAPLSKMSVNKLTNTGKAAGAVISPDGKYVIYALQDTGQQSLWVKQVATSSDVCIVMPAKVQYTGLTLSRDGNYLYYVRLEKDASSGFYQMPVLGGMAKKLSAEVHSPITLSPDGMRFAFVRHYPNQGDSVLIIANADGTAEQKLATRKRPDNFGWPAWSPDGKTIACSVASATGGLHMNLMAIPVDGSAENTISVQRWSWCGQVQWLGDGSGLVMTAAQQTLGSPQVWHLTYPGGKARRVTNDASGYRDVSLTRDSRTLITLQSDQLTNIWVTTPHEDESYARQVTFGRNDGVSGITWTPEGQLVYGSSASGNPEVWVMEAGGSNQKQLTDRLGANYVPSVSPDGRYIIFVSDRTGTYNIWRMDINGSNLMQLTNSKFDADPYCSPDGQWVYYTSWSEGKPMIWKVPMEGGRPLQVTDTYSTSPAISPDGKLLAYFHWDERVSLQWKGAVVPLQEEGATAMFDISPPAIRWMSDGSTLSYAKVLNGSSNIWNQPLAGGPPTQVTNFVAAYVYHFAWSHDGKRLACSRGITMNDVVLIRDFR